MIYLVVYMDLEYGIIETRPVDAVDISAALWEVVTAPLPEGTAQVSIEIQEHR